MTTSPQLPDRSGTSTPGDAQTDVMADVAAEERVAEEQLSRAEELARRLDRPMGALGVLFLFVVLAQTLAEDATVLGWLTALGWALWAVFVGELVLRAVVARDQRRFWRRNWWQVLFLAVPFLRFARALSFLRLGRAARVARVGGILTSAVRGSRSAGRLLTDRIGWLAVVTGVVVLASSQLLYLLGVFGAYADALHAAALATIAGTPLGADDGVARVLDVVLAVYSVAVFATLAGALGAYFLERPRESRAPSGTTADGAAP
jgi:voltage-gated potassium channel